MTPEQLQEGARLLAAATPGPWTLVGEQGTAIWSGGHIVASMNFARTEHRQARADSAAIAWLRTHAAELIADAGRLEWFATHLLRPDSSMRFPDGTFKSVNAWSIASHNTDLRAAIDAARASGTEGAT